MSRTSGTGSLTFQSAVVASGIVALRDGGARNALELLADLLRKQACRIHYDVGQHLPLSPRPGVLHHQRLLLACTHRQSGADWGDLERGQGMGPPPGWSAISGALMQVRAVRPEPPVTECLAQSKLDGPAGRSTDASCPQQQLPLCKSTPGAAGKLPSSSSRQQRTSQVPSNHLAAAGY